MGLAEDTLSAGSSSSVGRGGGEGGREGRETGSKRVRMERDRGRIVLSDGIREIGEKGRSETDPGLGERERVGGRERESERVGEEKEPRKRMIETSKELQENERRRRSLAGGRVVVSPTLPAPPLDSLHSGSFRI